MISGPTCGLALAAAAGLVAPTAANAQSFTQGNLVVEEMTGSNVGKSSGAQIVLQELTTGGSTTGLVSLNIGTGTTGSNLETDSGKATSDGGMERSANGQYLMVPAYNLAVGAASVASSTAARSVVRVDSAGNIDYTTQLPSTGDYDGTTNGNFRSIASLTGTSFYTTGNPTTASYGGVRLASLGATTAANPVTDTTGATKTANDPNTGYAAIYGGTTGSNTQQLFMAGGSAGLYTVGSGVPAAGNTILPVALPGVSSTSRYYQFWMADLGGGTGFDGTGLDTLYAVDSAGTVDKYSYIGGTWVAEGTAALAGGFGLTGVDTNGNVTLYATSGTGATGATSNVVSITDTGANAAQVAGTPTSLSSATVTTIATSTSVFYRGISFAPLTTTAAGWSGAQVARPASGRGFELKWKDGSGADVIGFTVLRQAPGSKHRVQLTKKMIKGGSLSSRDSYSFTDRAGKAGDKYYVVAHLTNGKTRTYGPFTLKRTQDRVFVSRAIAEATR